MFWTESLTEPHVISTSPRNWNWIRIFRWVVGALVVAGVIYTFVQTAGQLRRSEFDVRNVRWQWFAAAVGTYIGGMTLAWSFWHRVLVALGQRAPLEKTLFAFFASQLGKYVPGKAMVVVIRTEMVRGAGADGTDAVETGPAAASVFVETLTWLFIGSAIGLLLSVFCFRMPPWLLFSAVGMTGVAGVLTSPPVFRRIAIRLGVARGISNGQSAEQVLSGLDWSTMGWGWGVMSLGWCLNGLSLWLVLVAIGGTGVSGQDYFLTLACVCLATVAGFVSLLPGGIGVRELVMIPLLGARFGSVTAVIAAVLIRLVWLAAELSTSAIIYGWHRRRCRERIRSPEK